MASRDACFRATFERIRLLQTKYHGSQKSNSLQHIMSRKRRLQLKHISD